MQPARLCSEHPAHLGGWTRDQLTPSHTTWRRPWNEASLSQGGFWGQLPSLPLLMVGDPDPSDIQVHMPGTRDPASAHPTVACVKTAAGAGQLGMISWAWATGRQEHRELRWAWPPSEDHPDLRMACCLSHPRHQCYYVSRSGSYTSEGAPVPRPPDARMAQTPVLCPPQPRVSCPRTTTTNAQGRGSHAPAAVLITGRTRGINYSHRKLEITQCAPSHYPYLLLDKRLEVLPRLRVPSSPATPR